MIATPRTGTGSRRGFTALEITAVATIIALLAVVLIPIMRTRVEAAKVVAAKEDMFAIEKAQMLAHADTGRYFRLQDMRRPAADLAIINNSADPNRATELARVPQAFWNRVALPHEVEALARNWTGPQLAIHNSVPIQSLPDYFISEGTTSGGPIFFRPTADPANAAAAGLGVIEYPIDPWGNPYLFFGDGQVSAPFGLQGLRPNFGVTNETDYNSAAVYSLGPDGLPGFATNPTNPIAYYRGVSLGELNSDDLVREW